MRRDMALTLRENEYQEEIVASRSEPYQHSTFCQQRRKWGEANGFTMHFSYKCGEEIEVDWARD